MYVFDFMRDALHARAVNRTRLMRGSTRVRSVTLVAREQRRETPTTIRQYVSLEWRESTVCEKTTRRIEIDAGLSASRQTLPQRSTQQERNLTMAVAERDAAFAEALRPASNAESQLRLRIVPDLEGRQRYTQEPDALGQRYLDFEQAAGQPLQIVPACNRR